MDSTATALSESLVLAKTAKGLEEVKSRKHGLSQQLRSLLIVVDGAASVRELLARFGRIADITTSLQALVDQGFVAPTRAPAPAAPAAAARPAAPAATKEDRARALGSLTRLLHDALGPDADPLALRLEKAADGATFAEAVARCADALAVLAGQQKARQFREAAQGYAERFLASA
jgi:hypothetical protein